MSLFLGATPIANTGYDKANTDLSNLTNTGKNIANWSSNITNCITEIPQDIKLELNNGTLTLKAGSKVYIPNGFEADGVTPKFDVVVVESDLTVTETASRQVILGVSLSGAYIVKCVGSETGTPVAGTYKYYYDSGSNRCFQSAASMYYQSSFPICICTGTSGTGITSINQVFNGFGYIGSTVFALPGVKWLTADGRNVDGTLKNAENTNTTVLTTYYPYNDNLYFFMTSSGVFTTGNYVQSETEPTTQYTIWYKPSENILRNKTTGDWSVVNDRIVFASSQTSTTGIKSFTPKTVFHALDYNDKGTVAGWGMPSSRYINLTLGASGSTYTAPANGWVYLRKSITSVGQFIVCTQGPSQSVGWGVVANNQAYVLHPVHKGTFVVDYNAGGTTVNDFRFIYAEGEQ